MLHNSNEPWSGFFLEATGASKKPRKKSNPSLVALCSVLLWNRINCKSDDDLPVFYRWATRKTSRLPAHSSKQHFPVSPHIQSHPHPRPQKLYSVSRLRCHSLPWQLGQGGRSALLPTISTKTFFVLWLWVICHSKYVVVSTSCCLVIEISRLSIQISSRKRWVDMDCLEIRKNKAKRFANHTADKCYQC